MGGPDAQRHRAPDRGSTRRPPGCGGSRWARRVPALVMCVFDATGRGTRERTAGSATLPAPGADQLMATRRAPARRPPGPDTVLRFRGRWETGPAYRARDRVSQQPL